MKYFIDTEFLEGTQKGWFGKITKPTIDLISVGIVCEDGREYYAISKDFNLKEAWNRCDVTRAGLTNLGMTPAYEKVYWIRDNILKLIFNETVNKFALEEYKANTISCSVGYNPPIKFTYKNLKNLIKKYGKSNKQIAEEIKHFVANRPVNARKEQWILDYDTKDVQFYGYYSNYDWVVFCWLFGKMIDLPKGFPMYCIDLKQILDTHISIDKDVVEYIQSCMDCGRTVTLEDLKFIFHKRVDAKQIKNSNEHNALADARWNFELYKFLQKL